MHKSLYIECNLELFCKLNFDEVIFVYNSIDFFSDLLLCKYEVVLYFELSITLWCYCKILQDVVLHDYCKNGKL